MNTNVTKEGIEVKKGQMWWSLDFGRDTRRVCKVTAVSGGRAVMKNVFNEKLNSSIVSVSMMHKHARGWKLIGTAL